jgi:hypothetical protein
MLNSKEAAAYVNVPRSTLEWWRLHGRTDGGPVPEYTELGPRRIRYLVSDLDAYLEACKEFTRKRSEVDSAARTRVRG